MELKKEPGSNELRYIEVGNSKFWFSYENLIAYTGPEGRYRTGVHHTASTSRHLALLGAIKWNIVDEVKLSSLASNSIKDNADQQTTNEKVIVLHESMVQKKVSYHL